GVPAGPQPRGRGGAASPRSSLLEVTASRFAADGLLRVGDPVALPVGHQLSGGLPPRPSTADAVWHRSERSLLPGWPLKLDCGRTYALAPGQLPGVLPPTQRDVGVGLKPPSTLLLGSAGGQLCLGGAVGLLASKLLCGLGEAVLLVCLCELLAATD